MTAFRDGSPLCLSLPWLPPINTDGREWTHALGNRVEDAKLYDLIGHFNVYEVKRDRIHFYMHPTLRKSVIEKALRTDKNWQAFQRENPDARLSWADDIAEENG